MGLQEEIRNALDQLPPRRLIAGFARQAAVLMAIFERSGEPYFLLTRRTIEVRTHKGQISFPGGMQRNGESLQQTALRETFEEVGIEECRVDILGRFYDYISINGDLVAPFPGFIEGTFTVKPQTSEVAEVILVPFSIFADPSRLRTERMFRSGAMIDVYYFRYEPHEIWGLTAHIIKDFMEALQWVKAHK
jgi:8-oxo-dGTP pyrophosphatase MutT (NUDIX family)